MSDLSAICNQLSNIFEPITKSKIDIEISSNFGHLSTNFALKQPNPREYAKQILDAITLPEGISATIDGPGFVNFHLANEIFIKCLVEILRIKHNYGTLDLNCKISVDHTDPNPTGAVHIGHGRLAVIGDTICRFLSWCGGDVSREYLLNDSGNQIDLLVQSIETRIAQKSGQDVQMPANGYHGEYINEWAEEVMKQKPENLREFALNLSLQEAIRDLKRINVEFDNIHSEREMQQTEVQSAVDQLKDNIYIGVLPPPKGYDGEWDTKEITLLRKHDGKDSEEDIPIKKHNGNWTYTAGDIAFHKRRIDANAKWLIDVFGSDHHGHGPRLQRVVHLLNPTVKLDIVFCQIVNLTEHGVHVRMSKRAGKFLSLSEALEKIHPDVFRVSILTKNSDSPLTIDMDILQSSSVTNNPYYYLQYTYVRTRSVLSKSEGIEFANADLTLLKEQEEINHISTLLQWPLYVKSIRNNLSNIHYLLSYARKICESFNIWWHAGSSYQIKKIIIPDNKELSKARLSLIYATQIILEIIFSIIGIKPLDSL